MNVRSIQRKSLIALVKLSFIMLSLAIRSSLGKRIIVTADEASGQQLAHFATRSTSSKSYRRVQVQIVHRHGDRTPITPLKDEEYWAKQLVDPSTLTRIASNTRLIGTDKENTHNANGRGPFGKLTGLGLLQMIELGTRLRGELAVTGDEMDRKTVDNEGRTFYPHIFNPERPLSPSNIRVMSTNFLRTIQSVQGLLVGFFPDGTTEQIDIDVRNTDWMIPDPQPRQTQEQVELERKLSSRQQVLAKEKGMLPLAIRTTRSLHDLLASDAHEAVFGVEQELLPTDEQQQQQQQPESIEVEPLSWNQLAEITKCLAVRDKLPIGLSKQDQEEISQYAAYRWFEAFRHARLAYLAMGRMTEQMVDHLTNYATEAPLTIWSAHDSTLIGLMCAFRLEPPKVWPEYASCLMIELIEVRSEDDTSNDQDILYVRFSLNGELLKSKWEDKSVEMIPLTLLAENIRSQEVVTASS